MMNLSKIALLSSLFLVEIGADQAVINGRAEHVVEVLHPGISLTNPVKRTLFQCYGKEGHPDQFYMNVETVVCGDKQCRIDTIQIYWNELGFYDRIVLPPGVELEKAEGKPFTSADYEKLDKVLSDRESGLKEVYKEEIVGAETSEGVDAMTGATIILNNNDYVDGAVWTSYTLWHWVNGGIYQMIRNITGGRLTLDDLRAHLKEGELAYKIFALEQFIKRKTYDPESVKLVVGQASTDSYEWQKSIVEYLENAPADLFYSLVEQLLQRGDQKLRLMCLNTLLKTNHQPSKAFYDQLSTRLSKLDSYQEINLCLNILNIKKASSPLVIKQIILLLENKNFIIARRAYWFLSDLELSSDDQKLLDKFHLKHADSL